MKKALLLTVAAGILGCLGCTREAEPVLPERETITLVAGIDEGTRVTLADDDVSLRWTPGDAISVVLTNGTDYRLGTFTTNASGRTASFTGEAPAGYHPAGIAFYPADERHAFDGETVKFNLRQVYDESGGACCIPMVGEGEGNALTFKAVGGAMKFTFLLSPEDIGQVVFQSAISVNGLYPVKDGALSHGNVEYTPEEQADGFRYNRGDITYRQQISVTPFRDAFGTATAFIPLAPHANYGYKRITVYAKDGSKLWTKDFSYPVQIKARRVSRLPSYRFPQDTDVDFSAFDKLSAEAGAGDDDALYLNGSGNVKLYADTENIYGCFEVDIPTLGAANVSRLSYLNVWLDTDDVHRGQGGGTLMNNPDGYDLLLRGSAATDGRPHVWKPELRRLSGGNNFGTADASVSEAGTGEGQVLSKTFKYKFSISRAALGLEKATVVHLGISLDAGAYNTNVVIPSRAGYALELPTRKDFSHWDDVPALPLNRNNEGGSDLSNPNAGTWCNFKTLKMKIQGETVSLFMEVPAGKIRNYLQLWIDGDGIPSGQFGADVWMIHSGTGTETLLSGKHNAYGSQEWTPTLYKWGTDWTAREGVPATGEGWVEPESDLFQYELSFTKTSAGITADQIWLNVQFYTSATGIGNTTSASRRGYKIDFTTGAITQ